jgi:AraC-like DNA-binding protein
MAINRRHRYRAIRYGVETIATGLVLPRHRHTAGYATVVLAGAFEEASFAGRFVAGPGDVLLHGAFDCHANRIVTRQALQILRLPWRDNLLEGRFRVRDPDALAIQAERDPLEAMAQLRVDLLESSAQELHWTERLAQALRMETITHMGNWAESERLAPETVSRGFHRVFGVTPKLFRLESRARGAWNRVLRSSTPLTAIAHETGFCDQAHLSRAVRALTGDPPSYWRRYGIAHGLTRQMHSSQSADGAA